MPLSRTVMPQSSFQAFLDHRVEVSLFIEKKSMKGNGKSELMFVHVYSLTKRKQNKCEGASRYFAFILAREPKSNYRPK